MRNFYEVGKVYVWQGVTGRWAWLNGLETTVTGDAEIYLSDEGQQMVGHQTDTPSRNYQGQFIFAIRGDLRPKDPPPGEKSIQDLFKLPELEPA